jgi:hypothetical protein
MFVASLLARMADAVLELIRGERGCCITAA